MTLLNPKHPQTKYNYGCGDIARVKLHIDDSLFYFKNQVYVKQIFQHVKSIHKSLHYSKTNLN